MPLCPNSRMLNAIIKPQRSRRRDSRARSVLIALTILLSKLPVAPSSVSVPEDMNCGHVNLPSLKLHGSNYPGRVSHVSRAPQRRRLFIRANWAAFRRWEKNGVSARIFLFCSSDLESRDRSKYRFVIERVSSRSRVE